MAQPGPRVAPHRGHADPLRVGAHARPWNDEASERVKCKLTCQPVAVLTEACFHRPHPSQRQRLKALLDALHVQPLPVLHEHTFWVEVLDWLARYADHEPDWADGCLAVLSGRDKDLKVWTYDREFRTTWRRPNGTVIPLAGSWRA